ncbi:MAG: hypothetical protein IT374_09020 [Polyangiaceae bacterium]|nr:hypothetical protein [Polyangiaceae bacterium]
MKPATLCLAVAVGLVAGRARAEDPPPPPPAPPPPLSLAVATPVDAPWTMTLTNTSDRPQRVHADVRLLWLEVIGAPVAAPEGKRPPRARAYPRGKLPVCRGPAELRPIEGDRARQVVLAPGQRWQSTFDPVLLCGAMKLDGELERGAIVYPSYGYAPPPRPKWGKPKKVDPEELPFIAEPVGEPSGPTTALVEGPVAVVSPRPEPAAPKGDDDHAHASAHDADPPSVERTPAVMKLSAARRGDAGRGADVVVSVTLSYLGKRRTLIHVRSDDLEFDVTTPSGEHHSCSRRSVIRGPARDFFETWRPGAKRSFTVRVFEVCPGGVFDAPGVYSIRPSLVLHEAGEEYALQSLVTKATLDHELRVRVRTGRLPFVDAPAEPAGDPKPSP